VAQAAPAPETQASSEPAKGEDAVHAEAEAQADAELHPPTPAPDPNAQGEDAVHAEAVAQAPVQELDAADNGQETKAETSAS
jgi:hypothetical protein